MENNTSQTEQTTAPAVPKYYLPDKEDFNTMIAALREEISNSDLPNTIADIVPVAANEPDETLSKTIQQLKSDLMLAKSDFQQLQDQYKELESSCDAKYSQIISDLSQERDDYKVKCKEQEETIYKLTDVIKKKINTKSEDAPTEKFSVSDGNSTDFVKILHSLYEIRFFSKPDGHAPSQKELFIYFSRFIDGKYKNYPQLLSKSLENENKEEIFKKIWQPYKKLMKKRGLL